MTAMEKKKHRRWASMSSPIDFCRPITPILSLTATFGTAHARKRIYKKRKEWLVKVGSLWGF